MEETPSEPSDPSPVGKFNPSTTQNNDGGEHKTTSPSADALVAVPDVMIRQRSTRQNTFDPEKQGGRRERGPIAKRMALIKAAFTPHREIGPQPTYKEGLIAIIKYSPLNIMLLFVPVSWALHFSHQSPTLVFIFSALAIVPLAALLGLGTEQARFHPIYTI